MIKKVTAALSESVDRWRDIGLPRFSLVLAVTALILTACDKSCVCHYNDSLSDRMAKVKVQILWDERFQETPSGVTVLAYASNGSLYNSVKSNRTDYAELYLPQGEFTIVAFNQSLNELLPLWFDGFEKFDNTRITLTEMDPQPTFTNVGATDHNVGSSNLDNRDNGGQTTPLDSPKSGRESISQTIHERFVQPSPWLALSEPQTVTISEEELMNINTKCSCKVCCCSHLHDALTVSHSITVKMIPQVYTLSVNLHIRNLTSLASVKAYVSSLNRSINLHGESLNQRASMLLEQWQKQMTTETDGVISSTTTCLSMALTDDSALVIEFCLTDGKTSMVEILPLKDHVQVDQRTMTIKANLELEQPLPKVEGEPAGAFWVTVSDWGEATDIDI